MRIEHAAEIALPPEELWNHLTEPEKIRCWNPDVVEIEADEAAPIGVGSSSRVAIREGSRVVDYREEIVLFDRPARLATRLSGGSLGRSPMRLEYRLAETDSGTRLRYTADWQPEELRLRLLSPLLAWLSRRNIRSHLERLKGVTGGR